MPDGWEYKTLSVNVIHGHVQESCDLDTQLCALGSDGWELVSVTPLEIEDKTACLIHHFRRPEERTRKVGFAP